MITTIFKTEENSYEGVKEMSYEKPICEQSSKQLAISENTRNLLDLGEKYKWWTQVKLFPFLKCKFKEGAWTSKYQNHSSSEWKSSDDVVKIPNQEFEEITSDSKLSIIEHAIIHKTKVSEIVQKYQVIKSSIYKLIKSYNEGGIEGMG